VTKKIRKRKWIVPGGPPARGTSTIIKRREPTWGISIAGAVETKKESRRQSLDGNLTRAGASSDQGAVSRGKHQTETK